MGIETMIAWTLLGVLGIVAIVAIVVGAIKGYTGIKPNGLAWAIACGFFVILLEAILVNDLFGELFDGNANLSNFTSVMVTITVVTFAVVGLFSAIAGALARSFNHKVKKVDNMQYKTDMYGVEYDEVDENKEFHPMPVNGKKKPRIINRVFGALTAMANAVLVTAAMMAIALLVLYVTPLKDEVLADVYTQGVMAQVWEFVHTYTLDFLVISFVMYMIRKGWEIGFLEGTRKIIAFWGYVAVVVGPFVLLFSQATAEGAPLAFLGKFAAVIAALMGESVPLGIGLIVGKIAVSIVVMVLGILLMLALNWLMKKAVDFVDDVKVLSRIEKSIATVLFFVNAFIVMGLIVVVMYTLGYYGTYDCTIFFTEQSSIMNAFYGACEEWFKPVLQMVDELLGMV